MGTHDVDGLVRTTTQPYLSGTDGESHSLPAKRWLPVSWENVSPDGQHYAYVLATDRDANGAGPRRLEIHIVDVETATDRVLYATSDMTRPFFRVLAYGPDALYLTVYGGAGTGPSDEKIWRMDLATGSYSLLFDEGGLWYVALPYAWGFTWPSSSEGPLVRVDLRNGAQQVWLETDASVVRNIIGADAQQHPVILSRPSTPNLPSSTPFDVYRVVSPGTGTRVGTFSPVQPSYWNSDYFGYLTDSHGGWFGTTSGLILLAENGSQKASDSWIAPLGQCQ